MAAQNTPVEYRRNNFFTVSGIDTQFNRAVRQQQVIAGMHAVGEAPERRRDPLRGSREFARANAKGAARLETDGPAAFDGTGTNFRSAKILQDRNLPLSTFRRLTYARVRGCVRFVRAMGKVEPDDVDTCGNEGVKYSIGVGRWPDGRYDLGLSHVKF